MSRSDIIRINDLELAISLSCGAKWPAASRELPVLQPILVTLSIQHDLAKVAEDDDLSYSINYSSICKSLKHLSGVAQYDSLERMLDDIFQIVFESHEVSEMTVKVVQTKAPLHSGAVGCESTRTRNRILSGRNRFFCEDLVCQAIIGVNPCEREEKQTVCFNISVQRSQNLEESFDLRAWTRRIYDVRS